MPDGCNNHAITEARVVERWDVLIGRVDQALKGLKGQERYDEEAAQMSGVTVCHCCLGPTRNLDRVLCSSCVGGDGCDACVRTQI